MPQPTKRDLASIERSARAVAATFGLSAARDAEIPTTWALTGTWAKRSLLLHIGAPRLADGFLRSKIVRFLQLQAAGTTWLPPGTELRPARRTVFEWRDGLPGETPDFTENGTGYVLRPSSHVTRVRAAVRSMPAAGWVTVDSAGLELRADWCGDEELLALVSGLLEWDAFWA